MSQTKIKILSLSGAALLLSMGFAHAEATYRDVVRTTEGEIVRNTEGNCVRTKWITDQGYCAPQRMAQQATATKQVNRTAMSLTQEERTVYFKFDRYALLPDSKEHLDTLVKVLKSDQTVKSAKIVGYADRIGTVAYNQRLSEKRAVAVRNYLIANGYTNANVTETHWVGKSEPTTNCPKAKLTNKLIACLQDDRRVSVEIEYQQSRQVSDAH